MTRTNIFPQLQQAQAMLQAGRHGEAWTILAPLRQSIESHGQALRLYALAAQASGRVDDAVGALEQIARLENGPPEIIGALADMLGKAGRLDEALRHWDSLVGRHPELADAHLNRAVTASDAGQYERAVDAADAGLCRFPGHPRLLAVKAMALKNAGRIEESIKVFEIAVAAEPTRALTHHNRGVALRAASRYDDACDAFAASEKLGMKGAQFLSNWAAAALEAGRVDESAILYRRSLAEDPAHQESLRALTRLEIEFRGNAMAFDHYEYSLQRRGSQLSAWLDWIDALLSNDRYEEAAQTAERALRLYPESTALKARAAFGAGMFGDAALQLQRLEQVFRGADDPPLPWMSVLAMRAGTPDLAAEYAERLTAADPTDQGAWAILSIAWRLLDDPREHWLCDYERFVMETEVTPPDGSLSPQDYAIEVAAALDPLHKTVAPPGKTSLRGGTQSGGELFHHPSSTIQTLRDAVRIAAEKRIARLPDDPNHPFLRRKSQKLGFALSWSSRLTASGGHHASHYHDQGWMSSAYYARLPDADENARAQHEGWLQFGVPPRTFGVELEPRRIIEPKEGTLLLFPSYLLHGTIPFGGGDRLTASFDYVPL